MQLLVNLEFSQRQNKRINGMKDHILILGQFIKVYSLFKKCWTIETFYNYFKNKAGYNPLVE